MVPFFQHHAYLGKERPEHFTQRVPHTRLVTKRKCPHKSHVITTKGVLPELRPLKETKTIRLGAEMTTSRAVSGPFAGSADSLV